MRTLLFVLATAAAVLAQGDPPASRLNMEKVNKAMRLLHSGSDGTPGERLTLARDVLRSDDTMASNRFNAAEEMFRQGVLDAEVTALEEEMKRDAANTIIPFNLYVAFRGFAKQERHTLHGNERWVPYAEAAVARQAPQRSDPALDLARWHARNSRPAESAKLCLTAVEADPAIDFKTAGIRDFVPALLDAGLLEQTVTRKQQWLTTLSLTPPKVTPRTSPLEELQDFLASLVQAEAPKPLARRLLKAALAVPVRGGGPDWIALAAQSIPLARQCGAEGDLSQAVVVVLTPQPGESWQGHINFWGPPNDVIFGKKRPPGLQLMDVVKEAGHLPDLITKMRSLMESPPGTQPVYVLQEALLAAECFQNPGDARAAVARYVAGGHRLEPVMVAQLPGLTKLDFYRPEIQRLRKSQPDFFGIRKLFDDSVPEIMAADDTGLLKELLALQLSVEQTALTGTGSPQRSAASASRLIPCVRFMLHAGMHSEAEQLAFAATKPKSVPEHRQSRENPLLAHTLWRALHHAGRTEAADRLYREATSLFAQMPAADGPRGQTEMRVHWMQAAMLRGDADGAAAHLAWLKTAARSEEVSIARAEAWLAARKNGGVPVAWLATDAAGTAQIRWTTAAAAVPTEQELQIKKSGSPSPAPPPYIFLWPGTAPAPLEHLAIHGSSDGTAWSEAAVIPGAPARGGAPLPAFSWLRLESRRGGTAQTSQPVQLFRVLPGDGKPSAELLNEGPAGTYTWMPAPDTADWKALPEGTAPGSAAFSARLGLITDRPVSLTAATVSVEPDRMASFSGWVRIESPADLSARLMADRLDNSGSTPIPFVIRDLEIINGVWFYVPPVTLRAADRAASSPATLRLRLELRSQSRTPSPGVRVSCADWLMQIRPLPAPANPRK